MSIFIERKNSRRFKSPKLNFFKKGARAQANKITALEQEQES